MPLDPFDARLFQENLIFKTVPGAEHFLIHELRPHGRLVGVFEGNVRFRYQGPFKALAVSRLYSTCSVEVCPLADDGPPDLSKVEESVERSLTDGLMSRLEPPIRFRVSPLRFGRWQIRDFLCDRFGWENDPSNWSLNLEAAAGLLVAQFGPLFHSSRFPKLQRIPASMNPVVAAAMIRLLPQGWGRLLDPLCGAGTLLIEAKLHNPSATVYGFDSSSHALRAAKENLSITATDALLLRSDARTIPFDDHTLDGIAANLPFGKRVGSHALNLDLYPRLLLEIGRVLVPRGVAALLSEEKRLVRESIGKRTRLRLIDEVSFSIGGLHPNIFVVQRLK
jgi:tRNA (guanine6-N2)-methyltransferase